MDDAANEKLRFDSRLAGRRGWVAPEDLEQELSSLPDVSDKIHVSGDVEEPGSAPESGAPAA